MTGIQEYAVGRLHTLLCALINQENPNEALWDLASDLMEDAPYESFKDLWDSCAGEKEEELELSDDKVVKEFVCLYKEVEADKAKTTKG